MPHDIIHTHEVSIGDELREKGDRLENRMTKVRSAGVLFLTIAYSPFIKTEHENLDKCVETGRPRG